PPMTASKPNTDSTARWSNGRSPGSPEAPAECPTEASRRTTTGSTTASQRSTCVDSSHSGSHSTTTPGNWPEDRAEGDLNPPRTPHRMDATGQTTSLVAPPGADLTNAARRPRGIWPVTTPEQGPGTGLVQQSPS